MLSNNGLCLRAVRVTIFSNVSIIPTGFKFTELHALTLAACSYALLMDVMEAIYVPVEVWGEINLHLPT